MDLLDVNLLVSLAWPNHVHHRPALKWFRARGAEAWATTPVTESGFVRVSCNASAIPTSVTPPEAIELLDRMREVAGHRFLADDIDLVVGTYLAADRLVTYRQVTDAHLLAVARRHGACLATFDRGIVTLAGGTKDVKLVPPT
jgi:toxin-antitoxin system PIN domain toxin